MFFFFKQKTAYELRISDWSSDVCSSDLTSLPHGGATHGVFSGDRNGPRTTTYGVPSCGPTATRSPPFIAPLYCARGTSLIVNGAVCRLTIMRRCTESTDTEPQLMPR